VQKATFILSSFVRRARPKRASGLILSGKPAGAAGAGGAAVDGEIASYMPRTAGWSPARRDAALDAVPSQENGLDDARST
jgi:hypothetical protein